MVTCLNYVNLLNMNTLFFPGIINKNLNKNGFDSNHGGKL